MQYGILKTSVNTGLDSELQSIFSTPLSIISNQPTYVQDMINLKRRASSQNIQRWEIETEISPENSTIDFSLHAIDKGYDEVFYIRMPQPYGITLTEGHYVSGAFAANVDTISITGPSLNKGCFIQFTGYNKVYLVLTSGTTVRISPPLQNALTDGLAIISGANVVLHARYDVNTKLAITYVDGIMTSPGTVKFIEDI